MPQPTPFSRGFSFTDYQAGAPSSPLPGYRVDSEIDGIATTLAGVLGNLALIQRDDGKLADGCVTVDSMSASLMADIVEQASGGEFLTPNLTFSAHTLAPGAAATVAMTGAYPDLTIDIGVPKGDAAAPGAATLADAVYGDVTVSGGGTVFQVTKVGGVVPSFPGHVHVIANVTGLQAALDGKQPAGAYATTPQLDAKADVLTPILSIVSDFAITDAHNNGYFILSANVPRTVTFGSPSAGVGILFVNRSTVSLTFACPGGYYKNGAAAPATANLAVAPGGRILAFHEGAGVWTFDGNNF